MKPALVVGCLLVALGVGVVLALRGADREGLRPALGEEGLEAVLAMAPPLDPDLQQRLWDWMVETAGWPGGWSTSLDEGWYLAGEAEPPARLVEEHEQLRANVEALTAMLRTDRACLTSVGWLERTYGEAREPFDGWVPRMPHLAALAAAARWYAYEAMVARDPTVAIEDLARLDRALAYPGNVIDRMCSNSVREVRDRTWLRLLLRDAAPRALLEAWRDEPSREIERLVEDVRRDRIEYAATVGHDVEQGRWTEWDADLDLHDRIHWWWQGAGDVATWLALCRAFEGHLEGEVPAAEVQRLEAARRARKGRPIASADLHASHLEQALAMDASHRLPRVAASVLAFRHEAGRLPEDDGELRAWMGPRAARLDAAAFAFALLYERLGPDRFRVRVDPDTPVPALLTDDARERIREGPPSPSRDEVLGWWSGRAIEVRVPAR